MPKIINYFPTGKDESLFERLQETLSNMEHEQKLNLALTTLELLVEPTQFHPLTPDSIEEVASLSSGGKLELIRAIIEQVRMI